MYIYVYMYTCMYIYIYMYIHIYTYTYTYTHMYLSLSLYIYIYIYIFMLLHTYQCGFGKLIILRLSLLEFNNVRLLVRISINNIHRSYDLADRPGRPWVKPHCRTGLSVES